jgi:hypothetical protein
MPWLAFLPLCLAALGAGTPGIAGNAGTAAQRTAHLDWGLRLIREVTPATNAYASRPTVVTWAGVDGAAESCNRSVCSSLVAHLLMQAHGYRKADFKRWMGTTFPQAQDFHDAIAAAHGFTRIDAVSRIRPGDIVAIKYPPGSHPTGHVLVVVEPPAARPPTPPEAPGVTWKVDLTGNLTFTVTLDPQDAIQDTKRANNQASLAFTAAAIQQADVTVGRGDLTLWPNPGLEGQPLTASATGRDDRRRPVSAHGCAGGE